MNQLLTTGQCVVTESSSNTCTVEKFLGGGGQGEVYEANVEGKPFALKWYFPASATAQQRKVLEVLVDRGAPSDRFLWPVELVSQKDVPGFGYLMPLRPPGYNRVVDLVKRRVEPSFRVLATVGLGLADSFLNLHAKGLCYCDISPDNVFFHPDTGDVLICDNDNVLVDGSPGGAVLGTPRFKAPEVERGEALPTSQTDLYSLAALLFYILHIHHPLDGYKESSIKAFDYPAMSWLYGTEPVFIFDPNDDSNRPDPRFHSNATEFWAIYPTFLKELFISAFTEGIRDPLHGRIREGVWRSAMARLLDSIVYCYCDAENFYDEVELKRSGGVPRPCWRCKKCFRLPPRIRIDRNIVMLNHDTRLFQHHVDPRHLYDFSTPVAEVTRHPTDASVWGLKNLSQEKWVATLPDRSVMDVEPGRSVTLASETRINFGPSEGLIRTS